MKLQVDYEVYHWLLTIKVLKSSPAHQIKKTGRYELDTQTSVQFQNGKKFFDIAVNLSTISDKYINLEKYSLKDGNTQTIRLYNWNTLTNLFHMIGIEIDPDIKNLIVSGDVEIINEYLKDIYAIAYNSLEKLSESYTNVSILLIQSLFFIRLKVLKMIGEKQIHQRNVFFFYNSH